VDPIRAFSVAAAFFSTEGAITTAASVIEDDDIGIETDVLAGWPHRPDPTHPAPGAGYAPFSTHHNVAGCAVAPPRQSAPSHRMSMCFLVAQSFDVGDRLPAMGEHCGHTDQILAAIMPPPTKSRRGRARESRRTGGLSQRADAPPPTT